LRMWVLKLATLSAVSAQCVIDLGTYRYDLSALDGKTITLVSGGEVNYNFTFCQSSPIPCNDRRASLCQYSTTFPDQNSLAEWSTARNWEGFGDNFSVDMYGDATWCDNPRDTRITFKCVHGPPKFVSVEETAPCNYSAVIEVPMSVCGCCTPPTYASTRLKGGSAAVMQADEQTGNWFDENFEGKGQSILCSKSYDRCFTFTATTCTGSDYRPAPAKCFPSAEMILTKTAPLVSTSDVVQSAWFSPADGSYVITMPFGGANSCVAVSGDKIDTSFDFRFTLNASLWTVPRVCLKL